jgi:hypothetical protein
MLKYPETGICLSVAAEGVLLSHDDRLTFSPFSLYDLQAKKVLIESGCMYGEVSLIKSVGIINALHYALANNYPYVFCDSIKVVEAIKDLSFELGEIQSDAHGITKAKAERGLAWLKTLRFHKGHGIFTDSAGNSVFLRKWYSNEWGEIPFK